MLQTVDVRQLRERLFFSNEKKRELGVLRRGCSIGTIRSQIFALFEIAGQKLQPETQLDPQLDSEVETQGWDTHGTTLKGKTHINTRVGHIWHETAMVKPLNPSSLGQKWYRGTSPIRKCPHP